MSRVLGHGLGCRGAAPTSGGREDLGLIRRAWKPVMSQRDQPSLHFGTDFWLETADAAHGTRPRLDAGGRQRTELRQTIVFVGVSLGPGSHLHP